MNFKMSLNIALLSSFMTITGVPNHGCDGNNAASAQKENNNKNIITASNTEDSSNPGNQKTYFGAYVFKLPLNQKIKLLNALGLKYVRTQINYTQWRGFDPMTDAYLKDNLKVLCNLGNEPFVTAPGAGPTPVPYASDLDGFKKFVGEVITKYPVELVVIENEEQNRAYHSGTIDEYLKELQAGIEACHAKGIKVTNGGLTMDVLRVLTYRDLVESGQKEKANSFFSRCIPAQMKRGIDSRSFPVIEEKTQEALKLLDAYKTMDLDYVNVHLYFPCIERGPNHEQAKSDDADGLKEMIEYVHKVTGKTVISNETACVNDNPKLVWNVLQAYKDMHVPYVIWFSGDGSGGSRALSDGLNLRESGKMFRDFIDQNKGN